MQYLTRYGKVKGKRKGNARKRPSALSSCRPRPRRLSLSQYETLVANGFDGETVMKWTTARAAKAIQKLLKDDES